MPRSTDNAQRAAQRAAQGTAQSAPDPIAQMMSALLPIHAATTPEALIDAASTAVERGLAAPFAFVFFEEADGRLIYQAPASDLRKRAHRLASDALGTILFRTNIDLKDLPMVAEALDAGSAIAAPLTELLTPLISESRTLATTTELGVDIACVAPLESAGERLGALIAFGAETIDASHLRLLADHVACALVNLRSGSAVSEALEIDIARSVFDARKVASELERELLRAARYKRELSLVVIEATNLRLLRERFGPTMTEALLERLGQALTQHARDIDVIGAFKESGYTMVLTEASATGVENAAVRLASIASSMQSDDGVPGLELHLAVGHATFPEDGASAEALFAAAERRMYGGTATRVA